MKSFRTKSSNFLTFSTAIRNFGQNPANFGHFPPYIFLLGHFPSKNFGQNPAKNFGHLPAVNFGQNHVIPSITGYRNIKYKYNEELDENLKTNV